MRNYTQSNKPSGNIKSGGHSSSELALLMISSLQRRRESLSSLDTKIHFRPCS